MPVAVTTLWMQAPVMTPCMARMVQTKSHSVKVLTHFMVAQELIQQLAAWVTIFSLVQRAMTTCLVTRVKT